MLLTYIKIVRAALPSSPLVSARLKMVAECILPIEQLTEKMSIV